MNKHNTAIDKNLPNQQADLQSQTDSNNAMLSGQNGNEIEFPVSLDYANAVAMNPRYGKLRSRQYDTIATYSNLHKAAREGACDLIDLHLELGVDVNSTTAEGNTPLHLAASAGHIAACKRLLEYNAQKTILNKDGKTALMLGQEKGHNSVVALLENLQA